jgi:pimeloyl-ACP methyl ester carboxylesterase
MNAAAAYVPQIESRSQWHSIRGLRLHVRNWAAPGSSPAPLVMLHGWMDCSASFQFVVDRLRRAGCVQAPDWRGFGLSAQSGADCYWFPDYLADLDRLLDRLSPEHPVDLVAHSMGGNIAMLYAGIRPERVRRLINLEGMGLTATRAPQAPDRYRRWMDEIAQNAPPSRVYPTIEAVAERLIRANPRLPADRALFVARHWTRAREDGGFEMLGDRAHKLANPILYRVPEVLACWRKIRADVLWVMAAEQPPGRWYSSGDELERRLRAIPSVRRAIVHDAGHMLHHDQPAQLVDLIEDFLQ